MNINRLRSMTIFAFIIASCGGNKAPPPPTSSTGAFGIVTINGRQKLYLPLSQTNSAGHGVIAVVDVGVSGKGAAGAPALLTDIDVGTLDVPSTTGGDETTVVAASNNSPTIWFIDPKTDAVISTIRLDANAGTSGFSGGGGYVTGIAVDSANHRAILSVWNGFALVDLKTRAITSTILAAPSENFGFDATRQRIIAPFYACTSSTDANGVALSLCDSYKTAASQVITDGLNVIDLTDGTVYTYQDAAASSPTSPLGLEPDSAAADPTTGIVLVPSEGGGFTTVIDFSKATFDKASKSVTAPHRQITKADLTGVAVEPGQHLGFWEEEHSNRIGLADVNRENAGTSTFVKGSMPALPTGSYWSNMGDPHGIAVTTGIRDGHSVGFVVNSQRSWVARIDLQQLGATPHPLGDLSSAETAPAVTYLDARTKP